jgi:hypothetical protein
MDGAWHLFKKADAPAKITEDLSAPADSEKFSRIRCPRCQWQPHASDQWICWSGDGPEPPFDACGTAWHTFATRGRCPGCAHQWKWTSCLRCDEWSPHEDWYDDESYE